MNLQTLIRNTIDDSGDDAVQFRASYSGRGMYGRACVGITGSWEDCMNVVAEVISQLHCDDECNFDRDIQTLMKFSYDSMGLDTIVYWPRLCADELEKLSGIRGEYENGECPDCGEAIPRNAVEGDSCRLCDYVFTYAREDDDDMSALDDEGADDPVDPLDIEYER